MSNLQVYFLFCVAVNASENLEMPLDLEIMNGSCFVRLDLYFLSSRSFRESCHSLELYMKCT